MSPVIYKCRSSFINVAHVLYFGTNGAPYISVAAIATGIRSPVKFAQFIGRAQRVVRAPQEIEQNGIADVITHAYYKQSENYKTFKNELLIPADDEDIPG